MTTQTDTRPLVRFVIEVAGLPTITIGARSASAAKTEAAKVHLKRWGISRTEFDRRLAACRREA